MAIVRRLIVALALAWLAHGTPASAQTCTATASTMAFGTISTPSNASFSTTAAIDVTCSGGGAVVTNSTPGDASRNDVSVGRMPIDQSIQVRLCPYIGSGTYGADAGGPRLLRSDAGQASFDVFTTPRYDTRYPNDTTDQTTPATILTVPTRGSATTTITIYGQIPGGQAGAPTGNYATTLASGVVYDTNTDTPCGDSDTTTQATFAVQVTAMNSPDCTISTSPVEFGTVAALDTQVDAVGAISVICSAGANYTIALDGGAAGAPDATSRKMLNPASRTPNGITYGLYSDERRLQGWYSDPGSIVSGTGSGSSQSIAVYGRVPVQTTPAPGNYSDTVVVTLSY